MNFERLVQRTAATLLMSMICLISLAQSRTVSGVVLDSRGDPVIGANIIEKGTTNGVVTDIDGKFSMEVASNATIQITYIGYIPQEIRIKERRDLKIVLIEDAHNLDEVVVVGFGAQKKVNVIGSIATVNAKNIENRATSSVVSAPELAAEDSE